MPDKVDKSILKSLQGWKVHAGLWLRLAVAIGLASGGLLILQAWLLARTVDAVVFGQAVLHQVMPWLWGLLALFLVRAGLAWASEQAAFQAAVQVKLALRELLYRHVQQLGPAWLSGERSGDIVNTPQRRRGGAGGLLRPLSARHVADGAGAAGDPGVRIFP